MTSDIIKRELRRRTVEAEATATQDAKVQVQADADAAAPALTNDEKHAAVLASAPQPSAFDEAIKAALKESKDATDANARRMAAQRVIQLQTEARAASDAALEPKHAKVKMVAGGTLTLHQQNLLAIERDTAARDENRDAASEAGKAVFASLSGRASRTRRSREARAAEAARAMDEAAKASAGKKSA